MHILFQFSSSGAGQQCCYNGDSLMVGPVGGGTLDIASPDENFWGHMGRDVLPWFACCAFSRNCDKYYQRRPSDDGSRYAPPQVGKYFIFPMHAFKILLPMAMQYITIHYSDYLELL